MGAGEVFDDGETEAGTAMSVPIGTSRGSQNSAVPTDTAARVAVP